MLNFDDDIFRLVSKIMLTLQEEMKSQIEAQGHRLTGKLINSVGFEVKRTAGGYRGELYLEDYGLILDSGVKANRIPFGRSTGRKVSKYIQGLIDYFKKRGLPDREATGAAFATARVQSREGMPTRASFRFSKTGERTGFISRTVQNKEETIYAIFERQSAEIIELRFTEGVREAI